VQFTIDGAEFILRFEQATLQEPRNRPNRNWHMLVAAIC